MTWMRQSPGFAAALLALGVLTLLEAAFLAERWTAARAARLRLDLVTREWRAVAAMQPAPTAENAAQIEADLGKAAGALEAAQTALAARGLTALQRAPVPARRPEAFFDIAAFVESMRTRAQQAGVATRADERFGFSAYAHEAPETGHLAAVFRERQVVQYLMESLLAAQPRQLLAVQRERPGEPTDPNPAKAPAGAGRTAGAAADYFEIDPRISARVPGVVGTTAFRLTFVGRTAALRQLLNKLAEFELPVVVRAVEVAPAESAPEGAAPPSPGAAPLIARPWSRFVVTVEYLDLVFRPAKTA
jgi:hypothetical protein